MHFFDEGWEKVRETILANQKRLGVISANAKLPDWPDFLPKWDTLTPAFTEKLSKLAIDLGGSSISPEDWRHWLHRTRQFAAGALTTIRSQA